MRAIACLALNSWKVGNQNIFQALRTSTPTSFKAGLDRWCLVDYGVSMLTVADQRGAGGLENWEKLERWVV